MLANRFRNALIPSRKLLIIRFVVIIVIIIVVIAIRIDIDIILI